MADLLHCPFCGGQARVEGIQDGKVVTCVTPKCFAEGPVHFNGTLDMPSAEHRAAEAWNNRTSPIAQSEEQSE